MIDKADEGQSIVVESFNNRSRPMVVVEPELDIW